MRPETLSPTSTSHRLGEEHPLLADIRAKLNRKSGLTI